MKNSFFSKYMDIPYKYNGCDFNGCDCYGVIQLWYKEELGIDLVNFKRIGANYEEMDKNYLEANSSLDFIPVYSIQNHDVFLLKDHRGDPKHCGIHYGGHVLHFTSKHGCVVHRLSEMLKKTIGVYRYKHANTFVHKSL